MKSKSSALDITLPTVFMVFMTLLVMIYMDNDRARNLFAAIVLLGCLIIFTVTVLQRNTTGKA